MTSIQQFRTSEPSLYRFLIDNYECTVEVNGQVIHQGKYNESLETDEYSDRMILKFDGTPRMVMTVTENQTINEFKESFGQNPFIQSMTDAKFYNKMMNLANHLPLWNLDESLIPDIVKVKIATHGINMQKLYENYIVFCTEDDEDPTSEIPGDGLPEKKDKEDKEKLTERGNIKFTIFTAPDKKVNWIDSNTGYQKIQYVYEDKKEGISIEFLLGFKEGSWRLWVGRPGAVSYDDDPYCDLKKDNFKDGILTCLDKVQEMIADVKENPDNWVQFYICQ